MSSKEKNDFNKNIAKTLTDLHVHHKDVYIATIKHVRHNIYPYEHIVGIEKLLLVVMIFLKMLMPSFWVRHYAEQSKQHARLFDLFNIIKPLLFFIILYYSLHHHVIVMILVSYLLVDLLITLLSSLLLSDIFVKPISIRKQFISFVSQFGEIVFGFAILYLHYQAIGYTVYNERIISYRDAIYYSMCTISTVGYGDISQMNQMGSIISTIELLYGLFFIGIMLSAYVSKINIKSE